jgi:hypothetical protein
MVKSNNLEENNSKIVISEVLRFKELVKGHRKLIDAIGRL